MATKTELYERAQELDIEGRSSMDKPALEKAIAKAERAAKPKKKAAAKPKVEVDDSATPAAESSATPEEPGPRHGTVRTDAELPGRSEAAARAAAVAAASEGGVKV